MKKQICHAPARHLLETYYYRYSSSGGEAMLSKDLLAYALLRPGFPVDQALAKQLPGVCQEPETTYQALASYIAGCLYSRHQLC